MIDAFHKYMIDTKRLFDCLSCHDPAALCVNLNCDYNQKGLTLLTKDFTKNLMLDLNRITEDDKLIYKIFTR